MSGEEEATDLYNEDMAYMDPGVEKSGVATTDDNNLIRHSIRTSGNMDSTAAEINKLPRLRPSLSTRLSSRFTNVAKAMHLFKDRKKKRVDESHKLFLTAHCIRDAIKYTTTQRLNADENIKIHEGSFTFVKRTTLPITAISKTITEDSDKSNSFLPFSSNAASNLSLSSVQEETPSTKSQGDGRTFNFKEYAPDVFIKLRNHFKISQQDYMESLASQELYLDFQTNSKSGQFFFFSDDKFFMIKTLTHQEVFWLMDCLPEYYQHFMKYPKTLLVKFMGLYRVEVPRRKRMRKVHFIVMRSTFDTALPMHKKFDLKGSEVGRGASESDKKKLFPVLKDNDLEKSGIQFHFQPEKDSILAQMDIDCKLLTKLNMMDYSLLIGIFEKRRVDDCYGITDQTIREILRQDGCLHFTDRLDDHGVIYFMGIIDFLQHYNAGKKLETVAKGLVNKRSQISSVKPSFYAKRLVTFVTKFCAD